MSQTQPEQNEAFALIIDASSSAAPHVEETRRVAQLIRGLTGVFDEEQFKLFILGDTAPTPSAFLKQTSPSGVGRQHRACSLIAPTMEALVREAQRRSVIIVGSGEIFDLHDWLGDPRVNGWLLVRTGERSLQGPGGIVSEIIPEQLGGDIDTLLSYFSRFTPWSAEPPRTAQRSDAYKWRVDASGYPLVFVEPLDAYVHLFPVTKPQFERFIASGRYLGFDDAWYQEILTLNPRASYRSPHVHPRERLFMTGVTAEEALAFGRWVGRDYGLLTAEEWRTCYEWFDGRPAPPPLAGLSERLSLDARAVWDIVEEQWLEPHRRSSLRELSLITQGILEWVVELPGRYCGLGEPAASNLQRKVGDPVRPVGQGRLRNLGFRLKAR
ncbi:MAG: SUMF1/EgtB/PvdO family nonheme iron enzyme [Acidobacteria bacterium]|nr:SUMF1/EgtB/PvdO family nonheme iron enzyme [Acidobacteriota bacterium]